LVTRLRNRDEFSKTGEPGVPRLPQAVVDKWKKLKHDLVPAIDSLKPKGKNFKWTDAEKSQLKTWVTDMYARFDQGLRAKLETAVSGKTDAEVRAALVDAMKIALDYKTELSKATTPFSDPNLALLVRPIAEKIDQGLAEIIRECQKTKSAMG
jgi:hypothetical protein